MTDYRIRRATADDAATIAAHRTAMFRDMGIDAAALQMVEIATRERLTEQIGSGEYCGWLVEADGKVVAGAGVFLHQYLPTVANPRGRPTAYILNVYTDPAHRQRGLARQLIEQILAWCAASDIPRASLHHSEKSRSLYERLGFTAANELRRDVAGS